MVGWRERMSVEIADRGSGPHPDRNNFQLAFFFGTVAPLLRASDRPMAIACFLLVTFPPLPPLPELRVPFFLRRMALATFLPAAFPYLRRLEVLRGCEFLFAGIDAP